MVKNAADTQTSYLLAIAFDLVPEDMKKDAAANLVRLVHAADDHLRTGFLGTPHIVRVLDDTGHSDLAFKVLLNESYPSWFFSINQGATTLWERWNSYSREQGFGNVQMNSFNHYAYGAIGQWMYERLAGLAPDPAHPGYKHFFVRPLVTGPMTSARADLETPYGKASSAWTRNGNEVRMEVVVPTNTTATIEVPDGRAPETVVAGVHRYVIVVPK
jgi:alpha-L-rhamnosidase